MRQAIAQAAKTAAVADTMLGFHLHAAAIPGASREEIAERLERAFRIWFTLARAMSELEQIAPNAARQAAAEDAKAQDFIERKTA
jgi:hypothetical protein